LESFKNEIPSKDNPEEKFINDLIEKTQNALGEEEITNPMDVVKKLLNGGMIQELMTDIQKGVDGGVDIHNLHSMLSSVMQNPSIGGGDMSGIMNMIQGNLNIFSNQDNQDIPTIEELSD